MPNRLIREGLLESEAILSLPVEGRWLFITILLSADDVGLFEATEFKLARRAEVNRDLTHKLLRMLADSDLVRLYEVGGKCFGFIPKFRQRIQIKNTKHPLPPPEIFNGDEDAINKINNLASKTTVVHQLDNGCTSATQPSEAEAEVEELIQVTRKSKISSLPAKTRKSVPAPPCPFDKVIDAYHRNLPELPSVRVLTDGGKRKKAISSLWAWVMTSTKADGSRRATNVEEGIQWFENYFERARDNDFLMGRTPKVRGHENWEPDIDFLCSESGMKHIIEKTRVAA